MESIEVMHSFEYTDEILRRLQLVELEMLKELDRVCRKNNINYIIAAGTLLGAVRHRGFIPWDDDIDVCMLREDYNKFCEICKNELNTQFFLQNHNTDKEYRWEYARILKNGTEFVRKNHEEIKSKTGIFIDVFPYDNLPEKRLGYKFCTCVSWLCRKMLYSQVGKHHAKGFWNKIGFTLLDIFPKSWAHKGIEHLVKKYKNSDTRKVRCFGWGAPEETLGFQKEWFEDTCDIEFEGTTVRAPARTHEVLVHTYGENYMTPPPENERIPIHTAKYIKF